MNPYIIRISSTKGGVGKSVIATNLSVALERRGYDVLLVDEDFVNPCVGIYLGLERLNVGLQSVMNGKSEINDAIVTHRASGVKVLPQSLFESRLDEIKPKELTVNEKLKRLEYDFVIVDTEPGIQWPEELGIYNEALVVTVPNEAACVSAINLLQSYKRVNLKTSVIVNRFGSGDDLSLKEIEELVEDRIAASLSEDRLVNEGIAERIPAYILDNRSKFSRDMDELANVISSRHSMPKKQADVKPRRGIVWRIKGLFRWLGRMGE